MPRRIRLEPDTDLYLISAAGTESKAALRIESRGAFWINRGVMRGNPDLRGIIR